MFTPGSDQSNETILFANSSVDLATEKFLLDHLDKIIEV
ncbi:hypothetical protein HNR12_003016 [Streptomonospora nanhaiensis]|uniref:Uncharacterized protein n=1 Tax=Streptomonospora nanhaiensis TaxID=1323731 RepID=A0A853BMC6_9ACTN|nr:hypothetical protein [Streptomonospora nanhaiensis]